MSTPSDPAEPVVVAMPNTEIEAAILQGALQAEGIPSWILGGLTSGFRAEAPGRTKLAVRAADAERARAVLKENKSDPPPQTDDP
ncbi:hypothetical protein MNBD_PLANCTO03-2129 [hydrothermal vent metagenome]|uniref:DUF2007 domain-containing protein n=1 Tax=hydrothermal vent metagenome TaxID=652676 RepID=A0A3B1DLU4_9ZZZZ